jgi:hypothetical protein
MQIAALATDSDTGVTVILLEGAGGTLAMVIGMAEATSIAKALDQVELPRPLAHDLLVEVLDATDAQVRQVEIMDLRDGTYYAELEIADANHNVVRIDSRPSDAIALALRVGAPIYAREHLLSEEPREAQGLPSPADKEGWKKLLEEMGPEDFKYKM